MLDTIPTMPPLAAMPTNPNIPTNLCVVPDWSQAGAQGLSWSPTAPNSTYNVYLSDVQVAKGLTEPKYTVPATLLGGGQWSGAIFTVTQVNAAGAESGPSIQAACVYYGHPESTSIPAPAGTVINAPLNVVVLPQWNGGAARNEVTWEAAGSPCWFVDRDGVEVAHGLTVCRYLDYDVQPGSVHTYTVTAIDQTHTPALTSTASLPASGTALASLPAPIATPIAPVRIIPNDDSVLVFFAPVPGCTDYRIHDVSDPASFKYAGTLTTRTREGLAMEPRFGLSIEWNGIDPAKGATLVLEGVDKLGPFQRMEIMEAGCSCPEYINGQGDPSNLPNVLCASLPFTVSCTPLVTTGTQVFTDTFHASQPFTALPMPSVIPPGSQYYGQVGDYAAFENDKWLIKQFGCDTINTKFFVERGHFMDVVYDGGGTNSANPPHNNVASLVMQPKTTPDISGGKVLHMSCEVDAHFPGRAWVEFGVGAAGQELINIAKFEAHDQNPTTGGGYLRWQIESESQSLHLYPDAGGVYSEVDLENVLNWNDGQAFVRKSWDHVNPHANGTTQDLDKRHRLDQYVSETRIRVTETTPDGLYSIVRDETFPAGVKLPFTKCQPYWVHQFYHSANQIEELRAYSPDEQYAINERQYNDIRHWDNFVVEVLDGFPGDVVIIPPITPPVIVPPVVVPPITPPVITPPDLVGDGVADDTAALQDALDKCIMGGKPFNIPRGVYRITKTLLLTDPQQPVFPAADAAAGIGYREVYGFTITGEGGPNERGYVGQSGVAIVLDNPAETAVLRVGEGVMYDTTISNIAFLTKGSGAGQTTLDIPFTRWSRLRFAHCVLVGCDYAINLHSANLDGDGNGEMLLFEHSQIKGNITTYKNVNGMAVCHGFNNCEVGVGPGGTLFDVGRMDYGGDVWVENVMISCDDLGPLPNTLFRIRDVEMVKLRGGRIEFVDTVVALDGGTMAARGLVIIESTNFPSITGRGAFIDGMANPYGIGQMKIILRNNAFGGKDMSQGRKGGAEGPIVIRVKYHPDSTWNCYIESCVFSNISNIYELLSCPLVVFGPGNWFTLPNGVDVPLTKEIVGKYASTSPLKA